MRTIIPAIALVVLLCVLTRWKIEQWQYFREAEREMSETRTRAAAAVAEDAQRSPPTSRPATQPAPSSDAEPP